MKAVLLQTVWNLKSVYIGESYTSGSCESPFFQTTVMIDFLKRRPNFPLTNKSLASVWEDYFSFRNLKLTSEQMTETSQVLMSVYA